MDKPMVRTFTLLLLITSLSAFSQRKFDQYSLEAAYGLNMTSNQPSMSNFSHFEVGFRYMVDEEFGIKFDYGNDKFTTNTSPELGSDYQRFSIQGVYNIGKAIDLPGSTNGWVNALGHAGLGYSSLKSHQLPGVDNIGHVIIGVTPQFYLSEDFAIMGDISYIFNFTQHFAFDGTYPNGTAGGNEFTGNILNVSVGLTYYFGRNKNGPDWD